VPDRSGPKRPLWTCPDCGRSFVTPRMWHACARHTVDEHFTGKPPATRELFDAYVGFVRRIGDFVVDPGKTRIAFQNRARFAGVRRVRRDGLVIGFWLKRPIASPRFLRVEHIPPGDWVYSLLLRSPEELDPELETWLREAYRVGNQDPTSPD
jgi:Domain of unknown function (DUF5655)